MAAVEAKSGFSDFLWHHRYWLQIIGDHARMAEARLAPSEVVNIKDAQMLRRVADDLLARARAGSLTVGETNELVNMSITFKKTLIAGILENKISINMTATFANHMLNEEERYVAIIVQQQNGRPNPFFHILDDHKLWLKDAEGHADALKTELDPVEMKYRKELKKNKEEFAGLSAKTEEFIGYLRSGVADFPALSRLSSDAELQTRLFVTLLKELQSLKESGHIVTMSDPLEYDHMLREEAYYLESIYHKYAMPSTGVYDPVGPRVESPAVIKSGI